VVVLTAATVATALVLAGIVPLRGGGHSTTGTVFYVVPYHYGYAFFDAGFVERDRIEVRVGETVTLRIVPAQALPRDTFLAFCARSLAKPVGGLPAGDPAIRRKLEEDLQLGNVEHIVGIAGHPVYVTTNVAQVLAGRRFREGGPATLAEAAARSDPSIRSVTLTAKRAGAFDVLCIDSGMGGAGTCGWGHKWMTAKEAFVVRP
jgi:hypothetical protein